MIFTYINNPLLEGLNSQKIKKVRQIAVAKANLRSEPDYIYPVIALLVVSFAIPSLFLLIGKGKLAMATWVSLVLVTQYVASKLSIPFITPYLEESRNELNDKI